MTKLPDIKTLSSAKRTQEADINYNFKSIRDQFDTALSLDGGLSNVMKVDLDV